MNFRDPRPFGAHGPRKRPLRNARRPASRERFARLSLHLPVVAPERGRREARRLRFLALAGAVLIAAVSFAGWWWARGAGSAPREEVFLFEELPPPEAPRPTPPDPAPPKPQPEPVPQEPTPPPQFGMKEDALSESGDLAVATGNTLMTEADTVVKAPVAELPAAPEFFDDPPRIRSAPTPEYPSRAQDYGLEGVSRLRIEIDEAGRVTRVTVEKSGGKDFDKSALAAARATVFYPYTRGGKPVRAAFLKSYAFVLE